MDRKLEDYFELSQDWHVGRLESLDNGVLVTLYKCPLIARGKNKGRPNFSKQAGVMRMTIPLDEYRRLYPLPKR